MSRQLTNRSQTLFAVFSLTSWAIGPSFVWERDCKSIGLHLGPVHLFWSA